jgi:hypothetical protein
MHPVIARIGLMMVVAALVAAAGEVLGREGDSTTLRDGFETARPAWRQEESDATVTLIAHDRTDRAAHEGSRSERFRFQAGPGSSLFYSYELPKVPVTDDLAVDLYLRSDRPGMQLFGRIILPADTDPDTGQPSFVMVPGSLYESVDRWQRMSLPDLRKEIDRRARVLRTRTKRPVSLEGAYLDRLVLNLYGGPGEMVVYVDDLSISPIPADAQKQVAEGAGPAPKETRPDTPPPLPGTLPGEPAPAAEPVEPPVPPDTHAAKHLSFVRNRLFKDGAGWVFTGVRAPGANPKSLLRYGFDVLMVDLQNDPRTAAEAAKNGFYLMPFLDAASTPEPLDVVEAASSYLPRESVAFWHLGENLGSLSDPISRNAERDRVRSVIAGLRKAAPNFSHLTTGCVAGLFSDYARVPQNLDLIGVHPLGWGSCQDIRDFYLYLAQRRDLTVRNPQALFWATIAAAAPEDVREAVWGTDAPPAWGIARVQPEQLRLYTYAALAAGYRGIAFQADADLTRAVGRPLLIEMAFLNAEIDLFENIVAEGFDPIPLLFTYPPDPPVIMVYTSPGAGGGGNNQPGMGIQSVKAAAKKRPEVNPHPSIVAAAISTKDNKGKLLLLADFSPFAQFQPPQMAFNNLKIRVPGVPENVQAYEVTLGGVKVLNRERVPGGVEFSLPEFGVTSCVLVTADRALVEQLEAKVARVRSLAIAMAIEQAQLKLQIVREINGRLAADNHTVTNAAELLQEAQGKIDAAQEALEREDYWDAWASAHRAGRPLRILMYAHFAEGLSELNKAAMTPEERNAPPPPVYPPFTRKKPAKIDVPKKMARLLNPVSCPPLVAFNTLPQHFKWTSWIKDAQYGDTLLPSGDFEFDDPNDLAAEGWNTVSYSMDGVSGSIRGVEGGVSAQSKRCLKLTVAPAEGKAIDSLPPFLDHLVAAIRTPSVSVSAQQLLRISVKVKMPRAMPAGGGGLFVRDSLGGEPLQFRTTSPIPDWSEIVLFRRAPADGSLTVTVGLAGFAEALIDDLKIEPVISIGSDDETEPGATAPQPARRPRPPARTAMPNAAPRRRRN